MKFKTIKNFKNHKKYDSMSETLYLLTSIFKKRLNAFKKRNN